jgi:hypothetical protein
MIAALVIGAVSTARAQVGIGAGLAAMGSDVRRASDDLGRVSSGDSISYADLAGGPGYFATFRIKYSYGGMWRFAGDAAYIYFPSSNVQLIETSQNGSTATGVFDIGATLITGNFGMDITLPVETIRPYASAQATYTIFNRTVAKISGDNSIEETEIQNRWQGSNEWGLALGAGMEFAAFNTLAIDIGARYNFSNFFTTDDNEPSIGYLQVGATLFFGDLMKTRKEKEEEEDAKFGR